MPPAAPVASVTLHYRVMYGGEVTAAMNDSGTGSDLVAGDGIFTGVIPESAYVAGQMVRWYVTASDTVGDQSRFPLFIKPTASAQYLGTVVQNTSYTTALPVFEYFVENVTASGTQTGTRGSVFFLGEFYDNVFVRYRGGNTTRGRKFEFNDGQHFLVDPNLPRVDEINLNERGADPTYMRAVMSWEIYGLAGVPASLGRPWYTRLNNSLFRCADLHRAAGCRSIGSDRSGSERRLLQNRRGWRREFRHLVNHRRSQTNTRQ